MGILIAAVAGYLLGAVPTGYIIARVLRGVDLRQVGSGHTGGSNVARAAGLPAGLITAAVDAFIGWGAVGLASRLSGDPWAATAAGVMAVVGHDWSAFIRFGGGIGLTTVGGALLFRWPLPVAGAVVSLIALWLVVVRGFGVHRARATIAVLALAGPVLWVSGLPLNGIALGVLGGGVAIVKTLPDWNRRFE